MNLSRYKLGTLLLAFAIQLAAPIWMIAHGEQIRAGGKVFKFVSQPVDPFDAFRGRYVTLNLAADDPWLDVKDGTPPAVNQTVNVALQVGSDGFANLAGAYTGVPTETYLTLPVKAVNDHQVQVELPFSRYYLEESLAAKAETAYREHSQSNAKAKAYVEVKVLDGKGQLSELFIGEQPLMEFLKK